MKLEVRRLELRLGEDHLINHPLYDRYDTNSYPCLQRECSNLADNRIQHPLSGHSVVARRDHLDPIFLFHTFTVAARVMMNNRIVTSVFLTRISLSCFMNTHLSRHCRSRIILVINYIPNRRNTLTLRSLSQ